MKMIFRWYRQEFVYRFDPLHDYLKQALRTALAVALAIICFHLFSQFGEAYWTILAAAFITQTRVGNGFWFQLISVFSCGILATVAAVIMAYAQFNLYVVATLLALSGVCFVMYSKRGVLSTLRAFFIFLFGLMSAGLPLSATSGPWQRSCFILLGTLCALLASTLWRFQYEASLMRLLRVYQHNIVELITLVLTNLLKEKPISRSFTNKLHERRNRLFRQSRDIRTLASKVGQQIEIAEKMRCYAVSVNDLQLLFDDVSLRAEIALALYKAILPKIIPLLLVRPASNAKLPDRSISDKAQSIANIYVNRYNDLLKKRAAT